MNTQNINWPAIGLVAVVLAVLSVIGDLAILAAPSKAAPITVMPAPTPTVIVVVSTGETSIADQLASLRNQVGGELPSFDEFRAALDNRTQPPASPPTPEVGYTPALLPPLSTGPSGPTTSKAIIQKYAPDGSAFDYVVAADSAGMRWVGSYWGWLHCSTTANTDPAQMALWDNLKDWQKVHVSEACVS